MIEGVIFDMDGVLIDSETLHQTTEIEALRAAGLEITREDLLPYTGVPLLDLLEQLKASHDADFDPQAVAARKRSAYLARLDEVEAIAGAVETVRRIDGHYRTALASSSHRHVVDAVVDKLDLDDCFVTTLSCTDVTNGKPDPEIFATAASIMDVPPEHAVVVEDSQNGIEAAQAGGFHTIGFQSADEIDLSNAAVVASSMEQVERYIHQFDTDG